MNKKLLAVAVSSALAGIATAQADTANVNVYGKLYPQFEIAKASGATDPADDAPNTHFISSSNSNIGFKGDIDVGGGMKGWFKVEQRLRLEDGNGTWASRNSAAGLSGGFGNVFLGRWDTVYKQLGAPVSFLGLSSGNFVSTSAVITETFNGEGSFHLRRHGIQYETPEMTGFQFLAYYSPDEDRTTAENASLISVGVKWESGPLYVSLAHEIHNDNFVASGLVGVASGDSSKDTATRVAVAYSLPTGTKIGATFANMKYEESGAGISGSYDHNAYDLTVTHKVGKTSFAAAFAVSDDGDCSISGGSCAVSDIGASQIALGVRHDLNKRVGVFALATKIKNDPGAEHNSTDLGIGAGADPQSLAVGVLVTF